MHPCVGFWVGCQSWKFDRVQIWREHMNSPRVLKRVSENLILVNFRCLITLLNDPISIWKHIHNHFEVLFSLYVASFRSFMTHDSFVFFHTNTNSILHQIVAKTLIVVTFSVLWRELSMRNKFGCYCCSVRSHRGYKTFHKLIYTQ